MTSRNLLFRSPRIGFGGLTLVASAALLAGCSAKEQEVTPEVSVQIQAARTGEIGDGRVFVMPVEQGYNIRTGEKDVV